MQERLATIEGKEVCMGVMGESAVGLLLVASDLKPIYANAEAIQILGYPEPPTSLHPSDSFLTHKIQSVLLADGNGAHVADGNGAHVAFAVEFISGRRSYLCRPFSLTSHSSKTRAHPAFAVILERCSRKSLDACQVTTRFHLTPREQETLQYLIQGLTNKEIGQRMRISSNTVKAFLKLMMMKMGVSTRSGIIGKAVDPVLK
jgi:DNA-binding CsgD family transcriptional regulator